jgi:hypothetical protein
MLIRVVAAGSLLLLMASLSLAQEGQDAEQETATPPAARADQEPDKTSASDSPAQAPTDPFDYESSEQISEDLSVSFPVDI